MTIKDLTEQFSIQGAYHIKAWNDVTETYITIASGTDFEMEYYVIENKCFDLKITYMYAVDGVLNIEVEYEI